MEKLKDVLKHVYDNVLCNYICLCSLCGEGGLGKLNIPVAEYIPYEIVNFGKGNTELISVKLCSYALYKGIELCKNPFIRNSELVCRGHFNLFNIKVHHNEASRIPELVSEVTGGFYLLVGEAHIVSGGVTCCKSKAESVSAVLFNNKQGVNTVTEGLGHLSAEGITHKTVDKYGIKGLFSHIFKS